MINFHSTHQSDDNTLSEKTIQLNELYNVVIEIHFITLNVTETYWCERFLIN